MSNKEQLRNQINTIEDAKDRLERIGNDVKSQSDEINMMSQWLDEVQGNLENLIKVIPDKFIESNPLTRIYTRERQGKIEFLSSMLMITKDVFDNLPDDADNDFIITFQIERTKYDSKEVQ